MNCTEEAEIFSIYFAQMRLLIAGSIPEFFPFENLPVR
jgi:hypothetical protein